jgi:hypothetical protein
LHNTSFDITGAPEYQEVEEMLASMERFRFGLTLVEMVVIYLTPQMVGLYLIARLFAS